MVSNSSRCMTVRQLKGFLITILEVIYVSQVTFEGMIFCKEMDTYSVESNILLLVGAEESFQLI